MSTPTFLTANQLAKAQAAAEGFQNGPLPALNSANINTQDSIGNAQPAPIIPLPIVFPPYYPSSGTPNLNLSTKDMSSDIANNFVILDAVLAVSAFTSTTVLTPAQLLTLATTPVQLLPALAVGKAYIIQGATTSLTFNTLAYDHLTNCQVFLGTVIGVNVCVTGFNLDSSVSALSVRTTSAASITGSTNGPVNFGAIGGINPTMGDSTVKVTVFFTIANLP